MYLYFIYILFIIQINNIASNTLKHKPKCHMCKSFIPYVCNSQEKMYEYGRCSAFKEKINENDEFNFAKHCRDNENLCGKNAYLFSYDSKWFDKIKKTRLEILKETNSELYDFTMFIGKDL